MMTGIRRIIGTGLLLLAVAACSDGDDYHYPSVITDLVEAESDGESLISLIRTDRGEELVPTVRLKASTADSVYRMRCIYEPVEGEQKSARLYSLTQVVSPDPVGPEHFKDGIVTDPVKVTSVWCSGGYVNLHLGLLTQGGKHGVHFVHTGNAVQEDGGTTFILRLYHAQGDDPEAYTREVFLSCPLRHLAPVTGDSIRFLIRTYDGEQVYPLAIP